MRLSALPLSVFLVVLLTAATAIATPSKIIWIPSTDVQPFMVGHVDVDTYFRQNRNSQFGRDRNIIDLGFTLGLLPYEKVQLEAGFDYLTTADNPNDQHPWSGNIKIATPEDSMFKYSPAIAVGFYNARAVKDVERGDAPKVYSGQNIVYGLFSRSVPPLGPVPSLGRFALGYYRGSGRALQPRNTGLLFSWDRTIKELSDKLWVGVDYQGGKNVDGSWNFGAAWHFTDKVSLTVGYDIYTHGSISGQNTFTTQLDVNFP